MNLPKKGVSQLLLFLLCPIVASWAQQASPLTLEEALFLAEKQNPSLKASQKRLESVQALTGTAWNVGRTEVYHAQDQNDIAENGVFNKVWGIRQGLEFPSIYASQKNFLKAGQRQEEARLEMDLQVLRKEVSTVFVQAQYWMELEKRLGYIDSLYVSFSRSAARRLETGDATLLEKLTAESKQKEIELRKSEAKTEKKNALVQLASLLQWEGELAVSQSPVTLISPGSQESHPGFSWYEAVKQQAFYQTRVEQQSLLPDVKVNLFRGTNLAAGSKIYPGFEVGLGIPLFFGAQSAKVKSSKSVQQQLEFESISFRSRLESQFHALQSTLDQQLAVIQYYETEGKQLASQLREHATKSFSTGEIDFLEYVQLLENSQSFDFQYLQAKRDYLLKQLELIYFTTL
jgi:cobalt-zinc-cadmium resistance protein CzcA